MHLTPDAYGLDAPAARRELDRALAALSEDKVGPTLQAVADELPVAAGVEFVNIRLLGLDRRLHLVAASGCTTIEIRRRAFEPLAVAVVREMLASGGHDAVAEALGVQWSRVVWIDHEGTALGTLFVGARSKRRPDEAGLRLVEDVAERLGETLATIDRRGATLRAISVKLARGWTPRDWPAEGPVANLRPRERTILELYADGLSTSDIADLLVISPHTVRTHVKLALRRLGVHQRDEAAAMVRTDQVAQLL
jgi:DNA-binding CsgD family transcriptional regulator